MDERRCGRVFDRAMDIGYSADHENIGISENAVVKKKV